MVSLGLGFIIGAVGNATPDSSGPSLLSWGGEGGSLSFFSENLSPEGTPQPPLPLGRPIPRDRGRRRRHHRRRR